MADEIITCTDPAGRSHDITDSSRIDCENNGGTAGSRPGDIHHGICFIRDILTRALGEQILQLGGTYDLACGFRDEILARSKTGKHLLDLYYGTMPRTFAIVTNDPEILFDAILAWRSSRGLAEAMLALVRGAPSLGAKKVQYTRQKHLVATKFFAKLRASTSDAAYLKALGEVEQELADRVDQTTVKILASLNIQARA